MQPPTVSAIAQKLTTYRSTHECPAELQACLEYCKGLFAEFPNVIVREHECDGVKTLVLSNHDTRAFDVLLLGHIDTVEGAEELFAGRIDADRLYGRGTLDMKAFVATSLVTFREVLAAGFEGTIGVIIVTDEELGGRCGARHLVEDLGYRADTVLVPDDGESLTRVIGATKHIMQLRFRAAGAEAHACRPWNGQNAIRALFDTYERFRTAFEALEPGFEGTPSDIWVNTHSLGTISGGVATNEVPEVAEMTIDVRVVPPVTRDRILQLCTESCAPGVSYEVLLEAPPTELPDDEVVDGYLQSIQAVTGVTPERVGAAGGTDARYFAYAGMRTIVHQGGGANAQSPEEYVELSDLSKLVEIQRRFIIDQYGKQD